MCAVLTQTALNLSRPLVTYRVLALDGDALAVGVVTATFAVLPLLVALPLGRRTDRLPSVSGVLAAGGGLLACGAWLLSTTGSLTTLALSSAVLGLGQLCFMLAGQALVARWSSDAQLDSTFGLFTAAIAVGQLLGPLLGGALLGSASGAALAAATRQAFWVAAVVAACALPAALLVGARTPRAPGHRPTTAAALSPPARTAPRSTVALLRRPGVAAGTYASLAFLATIDVVTAYLPLLAEQRGISPAAVGVLLGLRSAATICSRLLMGRLLERFSRERLIVGSAAGAALALAVVPVPAVGPAGAVLGLIVAGFLLGLGQPLTMTLVARAVPDEVRSSALALRMVGNRVGQVAVPGLAGAVAASAGGAGAWWLSCAVLVSAAGSSARASRAS